MKSQAKEVDERLLVEAAQKDPRRFAELYENNFERVYAYIARRARNHDEAEDLTSEVFHQALENIGRFEWRGVPFAAWLFRIAANAIADCWKSAARETGNPTREGPEEISPLDFEQTEHCAKLFRLVNSLPADQRHVIEMRFTEEKSIREIAQGLRRTEGAVKQLQFRALQNLRDRMGGANA
ncbi:MAG: sigma-70 family RNA polymerase sigma factor [Candidatus Acidiferrales bacterium]